MIDMIEKEKLSLFKNYLSTCVNTECKTFNNKELISNFSFVKKQIGFLVTGSAQIIKTDIHGNSEIIKLLKENDIFSNLFFQGFEDDIYVLSTSTTKIIFIDYYSIFRNCNKGCSFHNQLTYTLFELLIQDHKQQNEKIELLSKRSVREKILFFINRRASKNHIFKVTTSYTAIAEYLAIDRSNFMRELQKLEKEGWIKKDKKTIKILKS